MPKKNPKENRKVPQQLPNPKKEEKAEGAKSQTCDVFGCDEQVAHSITKDNVQTQISELNLKFKDRASGKKIGICKKHYKQITKLKNKEEKLFKPSLFGKGAQQKRDPGSKKGYPGPLL